jgi:dihydrodipicolinate synthase/N-acetylneuraminate lyase
MVVAAVTSVRWTSTAQGVPYRGLRRHQRAKSSYYNIPRITATAGRLDGTTDRRTRRHRARRLLKDTSGDAVALAICSAPCDKIRRFNGWDNLSHSSALRPGRGGGVGRGGIVPELAVELWRCWREG